MKTSRPVELVRESYCGTTFQNIERITLEEVLYYVEREIEVFPFYKLEVIPEVTAFSSEAALEVVSLSVTFPALVHYPSPSSIARKVPITLERGKIRIDSKKMKANVFYKFHYRGEEFVARKLPNGKLEIFEVIK